ncbi:tetratricopeptide repeat protein [Megalodesulfovibrio paquesii]
MSNELTKARAQLSQVSTYLKQEKYLPAVQAIRDALATMMGTPLMRQEREEFAALLTEAVYKVDVHRGFRALIPLKLEYKTGEEKALLETLGECLGELRKSQINDAQAILTALEKKKQEGVESGQKLLDAQQFVQAKSHFDGLVAEFHDDAALKSDVGERFLKANRYEEAYDFLSQALADSPESIHLYNRIAMALRKLSKFDVAEKYYAKALDFCKDDPNLYFNIGRLYLDWGKWDKVAYMANKALECDAEFKEAKKMLTYALKQMG